MMTAASMSLGQALIFYFINPVLGLLYLIVIVGIILSWLIQFNVVNTSNQLVAMIWRLTSMITEPLLRPIRSVVPPIGGLDFSPIVLILAIIFVKDWLLVQIFRVL
jgi:YggT family protein